MFFESCVFESCELLPDGVDSFGSDCSHDVMAEAWARADAFATMDVLMGWF